MSYIKLMPYGYEREADVWKVVQYISQMEKSTYLVSGGMGIINAEEIHRASEFVAEQILAVQRYKGCRGKRLFHVIVSFDYILDGLDVNEMKRIADAIIYLYKDYQSVYALHEDTRNKHLHLLFNNIPLGNEKNLSYYFNIMKIYALVEEMIDNYRYRKKM